MSIKIDIPVTWSCEKDHSVTLSNNVVLHLFQSLGWYLYMVDGIFTFMLTALT